MSKEAPPAKPSDTVGNIAVGFAADLVIVAADPLADIRRTREIELVIKAGREVR